MEVAGGRIQKSGDLIKFIEAGDFVNLACQRQIERKTGVVFMVEVSNGGELKPTEPLELALQDARW